MDMTDYLTADFWQGSAPVYLEGSGLPSPLGQVKGLPEGAVLFSSSGSSGVFKWIVHTRESLLASARMVNEALEITESDCWGLLLPIYHVGGFGILARAYERWQEEPEKLTSKLKIYEASWSPYEAVEFLASQQVTITSLVPTQVHDLVSEGLSAPPSLRAIVVGGGQLSPELGGAARALGWPVLQSYGMSEAGSQIATACLGSLDEAYRCDRLEVLSGWTLQEDQQGRLLIEGRALCQGMVLQEDGSLRYLSIVSPFATQDRVLLEEGTLTFLGRFDRVVKVKGELVDLDGLEQVLSREAQSRVVVLPEMDARDGVALRLVTTLREGHNDLRRLIPRYVEVREVRVVSKIPTTALGKVDRRSLV